MAKFRAPFETVGINIGGQQFNVDAEGVIDLPDGCNVPEGFTPVSSVVSPTEIICQPTE